MDIDAHTACLCICMHIYSSKSNQYKRYTPYSFPNLHFSPSKAPLYFNGSNVRPGGIWLIKMLI